MISDLLMRPTWTVPINWLSMAAKQGVSVLKERCSGRVSRFTAGYDPEGFLLGDIPSLENDHQEGEPLIQPFMKDGRRIAATEPLQKLRERALEQIKRLPQSLRALESGPEY